MVVSAKRKVKKIRGDNEPKKPITEYFMFLNDERQNLQPKLPVKDQTAILSAKWKELDPARKEKYTKAYAEAFAAYKLEMAKYKETEEYKAVTEQNKELKKEAGKAGGKPKMTRKPSGYNLFVKEERAKLAQEKSEAMPSFKEISQIISKKWHNLTDAEKLEYNQKAKEANELNDEVSENKDL